MEARIRKFMEYKGLTSSELADTIGVQRSNVTHVLQGRNKPSFQFIEKLLQTYPELNAKWLLLGTGNMVDSTGKSRTLFDQTPEPESELLSQTQVKTEEKEIPKEIPSVSSDSERSKAVEKNQSDEELKNQFFSSEKTIEKLIVFYNDQTFKVYNPSL